MISHGKVGLPWPFEGKEGIENLASENVEAVSGRGPPKSSEGPGQASEKSLHVVGFAFFRAPSPAPLLADP